MGCKEGRTPNFALTHRTTAEPSAKAIAAQQNSLDSLPKIVLDSRLALSFLLAEQDVCARVDQHADLA